MYQVLNPFGHTDGASITSSEVANTEGTPQGNVAVLIGDGAGMSGEMKLKLLALASLTLRDRVRNVGRNAAAMRVEVDIIENTVTYLNAGGLTNEDNVACAYVVTDPDIPQSTEFLTGGLEAAIDYAREQIQAGLMAPIKP